MTPPTSPQLAPASARYARVRTPEEHRNDLHVRRYSCRGGLKDARRLLVIVVVLLVTIASLALTGYSAIIAWALFAILAGCAVGLTVSFISSLRELREIEARLRDAERSPS